MMMLQSKKESSFENDIEDHNYDDSNIESKYSNEEHSSSSEESSGHFYECNNRVIKHAKERSSFVQGIDDPNYDDIITDN